MSYTPRQQEQARLLGFLTQFQHGGKHDIVSVKAATAGQPEVREIRISDRSENQVKAVLTKYATEWLPRRSALVEGYTKAILNQG